MSAQGVKLPLSDYISKHWWVAAIEGLLAVIFGFVVIIWPGISLVALIITFGVFAIVFGLLDAITSFAHRQQGWGWQLTNGILGIIIGIMALVWPASTTLVFVIFIGAWALVAGITAIMAGVQQHKSVDSGWGWTVAWGVLSVIFGILIMFAPRTGVVALVWLVGLYAIMGGVLLIVGAFGARSFAKKLQNLAGVQQ